MTQTRRPSGRLRRVGVALVASLSLLVGLGSAGAAAGIVVVQAKIDEEGGDLTAPTGGTESPQSGSSAGVEVGVPCYKDACNYLVLGSDSRSGLTVKEQHDFQSDQEISGYRSDTIILVHVDAETKRATVVNFPRDLVVDIPGYGKNLINEAFSLGAANGRGPKGGMALSAKTVSKLTGMPINHAMVVDLGGFKAVVDALDYVPFCTPTPLVDDPQAFGEPAENQGSGLKLPAGCHKLDGDSALALVRARYVVAGSAKDCISDYARISRQQQFMRALLNRALSPEQVGNIPDIVEAVTKQLTLDQGLKVLDLVELAKNLQGVASGNADFRTVPTKLDSENIHLVLTPEGRTFLAKLRAGQALGDLGTELAYQPPTPAEIAVRVYDDASEGHAQNDVYRAQLSEAGFKMMATSAEPAGDLAGAGSVILYAPGQREKAAVVSGFVPSVDLEAAKPGQLPDDTDVVIVVDATYEHHDPGEGRSVEVEEKCPFT